MQNRTTPYISSNKLSEFCSEANAARRLQILKEVKRPSNFIAPRYSPAQDLISEIILAQTPQTEAIFRKLQRLARANSDTKWRRERKESNISAVENFLQIADEFFLEGIEFQRGGHSQPYLNYSGVDISVRPEIFLLARDRRGRSVCGAVKLYMSQNYPFNETSGAYAATLVAEHLTKNNLLKGRVDPKLCIAIDVFQRRAFRAPDKTSKLIRGIEAACQEIAVLWPSLR